MALSLQSSTSTTRIIDQDPARVGLWIQQQGGGFWRAGSTCIGLERRGELVAGVMYDCYNDTSIYTSIAITGMLTKSYLRRIFHYPFIQLRVNVLIAMIAEGNLKSQRLVEHMGFTRLTAIPEADPSGGTYLYVMPRRDCRFLRRSTYE